VLAWGWSLHQGVKAPNKPACPSNSATGVVGSSGPPPPCPLSQLHGPHPRPYFNKAMAIHIQPARKSRKLAAPVESQLDSSQWILKRTKGG